MMADQPSFPPPLQAGLERILRRTAGFVTRLLLVATAVTTISVVAGIAALQDGIRIVWIVLAAGFAWVSVIGLARIRWSLSVLLRHLNDMVAEVDHLDREDPQRSHLVIDLIETGQGSTTNTVFNQDFSVLRTPTDSRGARAAATPWIERLGQLARRGVLQVMATIFITAVFGVLALIFVVALAL